MKYTLLAILLSSFLLCSAQVNSNNSSEIYDKLLQLNTLGSVLYISATPADANLPLLVHLSKIQHYRTGLLSLTRGESIKNAFGYEQGMEAGILHVTEGIAATRIDNIERFFTSAYDVSFAKSKKQALESWDTTLVLEQMVRVIRRFQPDVIITSAAESDSAGINGQANALAYLVSQAYDMAADTLAFNNQVQQGLGAWHAKRLLACNAVNNTAGSAAYNPVTGNNINSLVALSKAYQKTVYYKDTMRDDKNRFVTSFIKGDSAYSNLMDGISTNWLRLGDSATPVQTTIDSIIHSYNFTNPAASVPGLVTAYKQVIRLWPAGNWVSIKSGAINDAILSCSGITIAATSIQQYSAIGDSLPVNFSITSNNASITITHLHALYFDSVFIHHIGPGESYNLAAYTFVPAYFKTSQPYWLEKPMSGENMYSNDNEYDITAVKDYEPITANIHLKINGFETVAVVPVKYKSNNLLSPANEKNVGKLMPLTVSFTPDVVLTNVVPGNSFTRNVALNVMFKTNLNAPPTPVKIKIMQMGFNTSVNGKKIGSTVGGVLFEKDTTLAFTPGKQVGFAVPFTALAKLKTGLPANVLGASVTVMKDSAGGPAYNSNYKAFNYNYLPEAGYYYRQLCRIVTDEIKTTGGRVGFLYSEADRVYTALIQLGYNVKQLGKEDFVQDSLKQYTAIVAGANIENLENFLGDDYNTLLTYVNNGGNFIVLNLLTPLSLTKPFNVTSYPASFLVKNTTLRLTPNATSLFNYPNTIPAADFSLWQRDYNKFVFTGLDASCITPLQLTDADNNTTSGSLAIKSLGKGNIMLSGLSLPAQLAMGVPGAYKLLANMVALKVNKAGIKH